MRKHHLSIALVSLAIISLADGCTFMRIFTAPLPDPNKAIEQRIVQCQKTAVVDPFDSALKILGKTPRDFVLPRAEETFYRLLCRFPLIEQIGKNPLSLPDYGAAAANQISTAGSIVELFDRVLADALIDPVGPRPRDAADHLASAFIARHRSKCRPAIKPGADFDKTLGEFLYALDAATAYRDQAIAALEPEELDKLRSDISSYFYENKNFRFMTGPVDKQFEIAQLTRKVDMASLFAAQRMLAETVDSRLESLKAWAANTPAIDDQILFEGAFSFGRVVIGGTGKNDYRTNAALIIDLGGDDRYFNNAGGTGIDASGVALVVDLSGNDVYESSQPAVQGFGFLGVGMLVDLGGDDQYSGEDFCQGGGYIGSGLIWDQGGNDTYRGGRFVQGCGLFGCGILADRSGNDSYTADSLAQGFGSTLGIGVLSDKNGSDRYQAANAEYGFAQGSGCGCRSYPWMRDFSFYGGVGMLVDDEGDDEYRASSFVQGASYFLSLGILVDRAGNDRYISTGSYSHGAGVHLTNGLLMDLNGNDAYTGKWGGTAVGNDRSAGIFIDMSGDDHYISEDGDGQGYSHKPLGLSLFIDAKGDDTYSAPSFSQGYVLPPITPNEWGNVIFIDAGGHDVYSLADRKDNAIWHTFDHAVGIDGEYNFPDFFKGTWPLLPAPQSSPNSLQPPDEPRDPFVLAHRVLTISRKAKADLPGLIARVGQGTSFERRALEEAITIALISNRLDGSQLTGICNGLMLAEAQTRAFTVMTIEIHEISSCAPMLLDHLNEPDPYVRKMIYRAIGNLKPANGDIALQSILEVEHDSDCLGFALLALSKYENRLYEGDLRKELRHPNDFVRMAAAMALGRFNTEASIALLRKAAVDPSPYVQKAAGESLLQLGVREGIKPMIEYLKFRALDTSSDNYGSNLGSVLMEYANVDFGRDYQKWSTWYGQSGLLFSLDVNLRARKQYLEAAKLLRSGNEAGAMAAFELALKENPEYLKAKTEYAAFLNGKAWNLASSPRDKADLTEGLKLARRCVELDPQSMYLDTLAEACYQNGLPKEALAYEQMALDKEPENKEYQSRLEKIKKMPGL